MSAISRLKVTKHHDGSRISHRSNMQRLVSDFLETGRGLDLDHICCGKISCNDCRGWK